MSKMRIVVAKSDDGRLENQTNYYFYLIAFATDSDKGKSLHFRVDRIKEFTDHR